MLRTVDLPHSPIMGVCQRTVKEVLGLNYPPAPKFAEPGRLEWAILHALMSSKSPENHPFGVVLTPAR